MGGERLRTEMMDHSVNGDIAVSTVRPADLSRALEEIEALRKCVDCIHGDLGLFKMAIAAEDPKAELLTRVKMIEEHINRARIEGKEPHS